MIGLNYQVADGTKLFGSVARKTRFPTLQQLYSSKSGNTGLASEESLNYTVGVDQALGKVGRMEFALFYYDVTDSDLPRCPRRPRRLSELRERETDGFRVGRVGLSPGRSALAGRLRLHRFPELKATGGSPTT